MCWIIKRCNDARNAIRSVILRWSSFFPWHSNLTFPPPLSSNMYSTHPFLSLFANRSRHGGRKNPIKRGCARKKYTHRSRPSTRKRIRLINKKLRYSIPSVRRVLYDRVNSPLLLRRPPFSISFPLFPPTRVFYPIANKFRDPLVVESGRVYIIQPMKFVRLTRWVFKERP